MSTLDFITGRSERLCGFTSVIFIHVKTQTTAEEEKKSELNYQN